MLSVGGGKGLVETDDQAGTPVIDAPVDRQGPTARVGERAGDLVAGPPDERRDEAVAMDDALATQLAEQVSGDLRTVETGEGVSGGQPGQHSHH